MRKLLFLNLLLFFVFGACTETSLGPEIIIDPSQSFVEGDWKLVKSKGSMINVTLEGDELQKNEIYTFYPNETFKKTIQSEDLDLEASGTYSLEEVSEEMADRYVGVVVMTFTDGDDIAGNCIGGDVEKEALHISKEGQLANISWAPCDGPWLYYEKQ